MTAKKSVAAVLTDRIESRIFIVRGQKVMLSIDLVDLYEVDTWDLTRSVKRNGERFPLDFAFQLSADEFENLKRQIGVSRSWGGSRHAPYAFTEQGVAMLSSVLRSPRAVQVNVEIMRAFVRLRQILGSNEELAHERARTEIRLAVQGGVRRDPAAHGAAREAGAPHRFSHRPRAVAGHLPRRLHVPANRRGVRKFAVTNCDRKPRRRHRATLRLHRTGRGDAVERLAQPARRAV